MNFGIIIPSLDTNQLAYEAITNINKEIILNKSKDDFRIFFEELSPRCIDCLCAVMNITELFSYTGTLISTNLNNTQLAIKTIGKINKFFYIWDLEFIRNSRNYTQNVSIYRNSNIKLIARSNEHSIAIKNYCGREPELIMPDLSFKMIKKYLENTNGNLD